jgi:sec-independent protein translocase protein TatA
MGALQPMHLIIVLAIVLLIFGPGKLPELGRAIGDGMRELKRSSNSNEVAPLPATVAPAALGSTACASCNSLLPINARFCGGCGTAVKAVAVAA